MDGDALVEDDQEGDMVSTIDRKPFRVTLYKVCKTTVFFLVWVSMGIWASLVTPCVDILKDQVHSDYEEISRALAGKSAGMIFGSIIGGYLADKFQKRIDLILGLEVLVAGLSIAAVPWTPSLLLMTTAFTVNGLSQGGISAGGNAHAIHMWGEQSTGPVHFIHFGYGIGTILGPAIMAAFLPNTPARHNHTDNSTERSMLSASQMYHRDYFYMNQWALDAKNSSPSVECNSTSADVIKIPFGIAGGFTVLVSVFLLIFLCFPYYKFLPSEGTAAVAESESSRKTFREIISPGQCASGNALYGVQMLVLIFVFYVALVGKDTGVTIFIEPVAKSSPHLEFSLKQTDLLITVYFICYAAGRLVIAIVGVWVPIQVIIFVEAIANMVALVLLIIYGLSSRLGFWLSNMMFALFTGPMFPSGMAWIDRYIKMTGLAFSILDIGIGLGSFAFIWVCGYLLKTHSHVYLYYLSLGCCVVELVALIIMQIRGCIAGDRYKIINLTESEDETNNREDSGDSIGDRSPLIQ